MTLTEFLTARLDEWEALAKAAHPEYAWYSNSRDIEGRRMLNGVDEDAADFDEDVDVFTAATRGHAAHIALNDPAFVLAQVAAIRAVMALHRPDDPRDPRCVTCFFETEDDMPEGWVTSHVAEDWPCKTIRALAQPWASHPDYPR